MMTSATGTGRVLLDDQAARLLVQGAHSRMHKWPAGFGGYRAQLTLNDEGCLWAGTASLVSRLDATVELPVADPELQEWVRARLWTQRNAVGPIAVGRRDGKYVLSFDPEEDPAVPHPRGRRVLLTGGRLDSWYRSQNHQYTQIGRISLMTERRVNTIERYDLAPDGKQYSSHYVMTYFALDGRSVIGMESYVSEYTDVSGI